MLTLFCLCRRHADKTAQIWLQKIRDSQPLKRLNLVYLANGTKRPTKLHLHRLIYVQRSPNNQRLEVEKSFSLPLRQSVIEHVLPNQLPGLTRTQIVAEATATAYKGSSNDIQQKLRRVVEVWRARNVFEAPILDAVDARVNGKLVQSRHFGFLRQSF